MKIEQLLEPFNQLLKLHEVVIRRTFLLPKRIWSVKQSTDCSKVAANLAFIKTDIFKHTHHVLTIVLNRAKCRWPVMLIQGTYSFTHFTEVFCSLNILLCLLEQLIASNERGRYYAFEN